VYDRERRIVRPESLNELAPGDAGEPAVGDHQIESIGTAADELPSSLTIARSDHDIACLP
jgi:hypothetical protein